MVLEIWATRKDLSTHLTLCFAQVNRNVPPATAVSSKFFAANVTLEVCVADLEHFTRLRFSLLQDQINGTIWVAVLALLLITSACKSNDPFKY
jgi:hypothetical protein